MSYAKDYEESLRYAKKKKSKCDNCKKDSYTTSIVRTGDKSNENWCKGCCDTQKCSTCAECGCTCAKGVCCKCGGK